MVCNDGVRSKVIENHTWCIMCLESLSTSICCHPSTREQRNDKKKQSSSMKGGSHLLQTPWKISTKDLSLSTLAKTGNWENVSPIRTLGESLTHPSKGPKDRVSNVIKEGKPKEKNIYIIMIWRFWEISVTSSEVFRHTIEPPLLFLDFEMSSLLT